jgi:hypothetical protein
VKYSRNLIFEIGGHMDQVFQALIDRSRVPQKQSDQAFASRRSRSTLITRRAESQTARSQLRNHSYGHAICFPGTGTGSLNIDNYFFKLRR